MKRRRKTVTLSLAMTERVEELAVKWGVSESEVLRRLFGMGELLASEFDAGHRIVSEDPETGERTVFKFIAP